MVQKITLMESYLIETLRTNGISEAEIMKQVQSRTVEQFKQYDNRFDFTGLYALDEAGILKDVLENGYEIKFLTYTGLVNMLELRFNKHEQKDYVAEDFTIFQLQLTKEELATLSQMLSNNWMLSSHDEGITIKPMAKPAHG